MGRLRVWLFHLLSRLAVSPPADPLPRPSSDDIKAVRILIAAGDLAGVEKYMTVMFESGYTSGYKDGQQQASKKRARSPLDVPTAPLTPATRGNVTVLVDKGGQQLAQREMTSPTWLDKQQIDLTGPLKIPYYLEQIHTQHSLPSLPAVSPLRKSKLTKMLHEAVPPVVHKTRKLTPLPEPEPMMEEDDWLNGTTKRRKAV